MNQPIPAVGSVWKSRYTTGLRVTVTETDGTRIRVADINPDTGLPYVRARWTPVRRFLGAYTEETAR